MPCRELTFSVMCHGSTYITDPASNMYISLDLFMQDCGGHISIHNSLLSGNEDAARATDSGSEKSKSAILPVLYESLYFFMVQS